MSTLSLLASMDGGNNTAIAAIAVVVGGLLALLCSGNKEETQKPKPKRPTHRLGQDFEQLEPRG